MLTMHDPTGPEPPDPSDLTHVCAGYTAPDGWHAVYIALDEAGRWQVFDASTTGFVLVETLTGHDDLLDQAEALALDYASQQSAYLSGRRNGSPLPRPQILAGAPRAA
jgi:hypothetical protein